MRVVNGVLCAILILFGVLQYNDPDGLYWAGVYLLAALWPGLAAWRPEIFAARAPLRYAGWASAILFLLGAAWLAPTIGADWIHVETARESIGYALCALATILALWSGSRPTGLRDIGDSASPATRS
jgi:Transmembrane family 220, helix